MPLKPPLPSLVFLPRSALSALLFQANRKPGVVAQLVQILQLALLAMYQRLQFGLLHAGTR